MSERFKSRWSAAAALAVSATLLAACGGGSSDVAGDTGGAKADTTLTLVAPFRSTRSAMGQSLTADVRAANQFAADLCTRKHASPGVAFRLRGG